MNRFVLPRQRCALIYLPMAEGTPEQPIERVGDRHGAIQARDLRRVHGAIAIYGEKLSFHLGSTIELLQARASRRDDTGPRCGRARLGNHSAPIGARDRPDDRLDGSADLDPYKYSPPVGSCAVTVA